MSKLSLPQCLLIDEISHIGEWYDFDAAELEIICGVDDWQFGMLIDAIGRIADLPIAISLAEQLDNIGRNCPRKLSFKIVSVDLHNGFAELEMSHPKCNSHLSHYCHVFLHASPYAFFERSELLRGDLS